MGVIPPNSVLKILTNKVLIPHILSQNPQNLSGTDEVLSPHYYSTPNLHILIPNKGLILNPHT